MLTGEVIVVTGASRGIGRAIALCFGQEGAKVVCAARTKYDIANVVKEIKSKGGEAISITTDIQDEKSVINLIERTIAEYGKLDTLVNNAAVGLKTISDGPKPLCNVSREEWEIIIGTNLTGSFLCSKYALQYMIPASKGNIINVSSGRGQEPRYGIGPYVCSKFGLEGLTKQMALELAEFGINVNSLIPGGSISDTGFYASYDEETKQKKVSSPPEIVNEAASFLAYQKPFQISGKILVAKEFKEKKFNNRSEAESWVKSL